MLGWIVKGMGCDKKNPTNVKTWGQWSILEQSFHLLPSIFSKIQQWFPKMDIDIFASRLNKKLNNYVSLHPEPGTYAIDALSLHWSGMLYFIFRPFMQECCRK